MEKDSTGTWNWPTGQMSQASTQGTGYWHHNEPSYHPFANSSTVRLQDGVYKMNDRLEKFEFYRICKIPF